MSGFEKVADNLHRITLSYKDIFTTVYLLSNGAEHILFDAASFDEDYDTLYPALCEMGVTAENLKYIFISHAHTDHAGGLKKLITAFPETTIVSRSDMLAKKYENYRVFAPAEGDMLLDTYRVIPIVGHTVDSAALLDTRTDTLITGDCLQLWGICGAEDWASNINFPTEYLKALEKLEQMSISAIYTAHDYHPYGYFAVGKRAVARLLKACREPLSHIKELILNNPQADDAAIRAMFNAKGNRPTVREAVVRAMRAALHEKKESEKKTLNKEIVRRLLVQNLAGNAFELVFSTLLVGGMIALIIYCTACINSLFFLFLIPMLLIVAMIVIRWRHFVVAVHLVRVGRFYIVKDKFSHSVEYVYGPMFYKLSFDAFFNIPLLEGRYSHRHLYCFYDYGEVISELFTLKYARNGTEVYLVVLDNEQHTVVDYFFDARFYELAE